MIKELRVMLYPFCAVNVKESKQNVMKDYLSLVDVYGLTHMFAVTNTEKNSYLKVSRMPSGPTITFKIDKYCLSSDILNVASHKVPLSKQFYHTPIVILNGFNSKEVPLSFATPVQVVSSMFQSIFPPLNLNELEVKNAKKAILFNLDIGPDGDPIFEMRHYCVSNEVATGKKTIANIINAKKQDLSKFENISEYILKQTGFTDNSDNEGGDNEVKLVEAPSKSKDSKVKENSVKVKLREVGPRLNLKLVKIEEGFFKGNVAFHSLVKKSKKEIFEKSKEIKQKQEEKRKRREEQEANVRKKEEEKYNQLPEEEKERLNQEQQKEEQMLSRKRWQEKKDAEEAEKQKVMTKGDLKELKKLKQGK